MNPRAIYANWEAFSHKADTAEGVAELEHLHQICFEEPVPKDLVKDPIELSIRVFVQLAATALDRLDSGSKTPGPRGMAKKLENRMYECLSFEVPHNIKMPPQAKECLKFLAELAALDEYKINESRAIVTIPEKVVREKVMRDQLRLHTRQDPWRIFQYYRPVLIKEKLIRLV